jgi:hypothetical protein
VIGIGRIRKQQRSVAPRPQIPVFLASAHRIQQHLPERLQRGAAIDCLPPLHNPDEAHRIIGEARQQAPIAIGTV